MAAKKPARKAKAKTLKKAKKLEANKPLSAGNVNNWGNPGKVATN